MNYISDYNASEFKTKLSNLIEKTSDDKFSIHFQNVITKQTNTLSGKVKGNNFVIWNYDHFWSGMGYSVIHGKIIDNGKTCIIELHTKLNSFGIAFVFIISCLLGYSILTGIVIQNNNSFKFVILRILVGIVLFLLFQSVPFITYYNSKKELVKILTENLKLRKNVY